MILAAHQPQFMPWLGYFGKMKQADVFVILDDVQFKKNEWQNRNRIRTHDGPQWLTVPVLHDFGQNINEVRTNNAVGWQARHLKALQGAYAKAPAFTRVMAEMHAFYAKPLDMLYPVNMESIHYLRGKLGVDTPLKFSSEVKPKGVSTERLVSLCKILGADTYLAGAGGKEYMDMALFERAHIRVMFQEFNHPAYFQPGEDFIAFLSALDAVFSLGDTANRLLGEKK